MAVLPGSSAGSNAGRLFMRETKVTLEVKVNVVLQVEPDLVRALAKLITQGEYMRAALDRLTKEVAESRTVGTSILALITGLADQVRNLPADRAAIDALADDLDAQQRELMVAVTANTPTPPAPPVVDVPTTTTPGQDGSQPVA